jgi:hypothetical protein
MAEGKGNSVGVTRKGMVIKDQGFVPYSEVKKEDTPDVAKATSISGKNRGMGEALRGGTFKIC